jgi:uridine monophosphate synthetase
VKARLQENGYQAHSALTIAEVKESLYQAGRINEAQFKAIAESAKFLTMN